MGESDEAKQFASRLSGVALETPWADVSGQLDLGKDAPFALQGLVDAARRDPLPVSARLELTGELAALKFQLNAAAEGMSFLASGEAAPFAKVRLPRLLVRLDAVRVLREPLACHRERHDL